MSHLTVLKTKVSRFDRETLLDVLRRSFEDLEIVYSTTSVRDVYVTITAPIILRHKSGRYIGINPTTGEILGDPYGWASTFNKITSAIVQKYIATVIAKKLHSMGYNIKISQTEKAIVGMGVKV